MRVYAFMQLMRKGAKQRFKESVFIAGMLFVWVYVFFSCEKLIKMRCSMLDQTWQIMGRLHLGELCFCFQPKQHTNKLAFT